MAEENKLHDLFYRVLNEYGEVFDEVYRTKNFAHEFGSVIRRDIPAAISAFPEIDKSIYKVEGKCGIGQWATFPYIPVFDKRITKSAKKGVYVVYLINKDKKEMTLALGIGTTEGVGMYSEESPAVVASATRTVSADKMDGMRARCREIRDKIGDATDLVHDDANNSGAEIYDAACIYNKKYELATLPNDEELKADLLKFLDTYKKYYEIYVGGAPMPTAVADHWPSGARDTTEFPKVSVSVDVSFRDHLKDFTKLDNVGWTDYDAMDEASGSKRTGQRWRTYRKMYEKFGLVMQDGDKMKLSRLGHQMATLEDDLETQKESVLDKLRTTAIDILSRYQLRNPVDNDPLPDTCDVLPSICIWKAMRELDNKLHPEEVNRVILRVMQMDELDDAIETIKTARELLDGKYAGQSEADLLEALGEPVHTDQVQARIAPWFSFVGWGGLIIKQSVDSDGYRNLTEASIPIIDEILSNPPSYYEAKDEADWLEYYIGENTDSPETEEELPAEEEQKDNENMVKLPKRFPRTDKTWPLNQILYGAPGTGKTYSTAEYACAIVEKRPVSTEKMDEAGRKQLMEKYQGHVEAGLITFTTFHQSYGYEDFIQGIRPDLNASTIAFRKVDGVFKKIADEALGHPDYNYVIIIDEINRANISRVFGELITLIEEDKRWGELNQLSATLPMGELFVVPNNLYIIGTMNSADKSISLLDTALRRRFSFIEMPPIEDSVENPTLRQVMSKLNQYLKKELRSTDLLIGHAYFIGKQESDLLSIMNNSIIPLLYEYFYDDANKVEKALECLDGTDYEVDPEPLGRVTIRKKDTADA